MQHGHMNIKKLPCDT